MTPTHERTKRTTKSTSGENQNPHYQLASGSLHPRIRESRNRLGFTTFISNALTVKRAIFCAGWRCPPKKSMFKRSGSTQYGCLLSQKSWKKNSGKTQSYIKKPFAT